MRDEWFEWRCRRVPVRRQRLRSNAMRRVAIPLALAGALVVSGCQGMNADTGGRTVGGAAIGAAGGAIIGALAGAPGTGAAIGALVGSTGGLLYDQYKKSEDE
jgi:hypothetical protein